MKHNNIASFYLFILFFGCHSIFGFSNPIPSSVHLQQVDEICDNRIDDDGDGLIDCMDPDCQSDITCFECTSDFYQVHSNSALVVLDPSDGTYTQVGTITGATVINGQGFNVIDGHVYAPAIIDGQQKLSRINADGSVVDLGLDLELSSIYFVGTIDDQGMMYLSRGGANIIKIDLTQPQLSVTNTSMSHPGIADFAFIIQTQKLYGVNNAAQLVEVDPVTEDIQSFDLSGAINNESGAFGAAWASNDGYVFVYNNSSGKIFKIDITEKTSTQVINGTGNLSTNDGFNCINSTPPFESSCNNNIDDDGDGMVDCADGDCYTDNRCVVEICDNGIDDDGDGLTDCQDTECSPLSTCNEICDNGIDDNGDGLIDENDPLCSSSSSNNGGLESNRRLASKITHRFYSKEKKDANPTPAPQSMQAFEPIMVKKIKAQHRFNIIDISNFIPENNIPNSTAYISTPNDLTYITNALDVFAIDYFKSENRIASILALTSEKEVYEHTKYTCDRLNGGQIDDISTMRFENKDFIVAEIRQQNKNREYNCSFSVFLKDDQTFQLENHWAINQYPDKDIYYNFQVWANTYEDLIAIMQDLLDRIKKISPISTTHTSSPPEIFIQRASYEQGSLQLTLKNTTAVSEINFVGTTTSTELDQPESYEQEYVLGGDRQEKVELDLGTVFDVGLKVFHDSGESFDAIYQADGAWGLDYSDDGARIETFEIASNTPSDNDRFTINRDINISGSVKEYVSVYRSIHPSFRAENLSAYNTLSFEAEGTGVLEVTLVKGTTDVWADQYRATVVLDQANGLFEIPITKFFNNSDVPMTWKDITMLVFTYKGNGNQYTSFDLDLKNVYFSERELPTTVAQMGSSSISPNPFSIEAVITFQVDQNQDYTYSLYNPFGKIVAREVGFCTKGLNEIPIRLFKNNPGIYIYSIDMASGQVIRGKALQTP